MFNLFRSDSKITQTLSKVGFLLWIQLLTLLCCLPIVTVGASLTAMHKVLLQLYRGSESGLTGTFFKAFKENFRQATVLWLIYLAVFALLGFNYLVALNAENVLMGIALILIPILAFLVLCTFVWVFPFQSRYKNSIGQTLRLSFTMILSRPFLTVVMAVIALIPVAALVLSLYLLYYVLLIGFSGPGYLQTVIYSRIFEYLEDTNHSEETAE